jgi:hypothetical protein
MHYIALSRLKKGVARHPPFGEGLPDTHRLARGNSNRRQSLGVWVSGTPTNVLFICGGAFVGLEDFIAKRLGQAGFRFRLGVRKLPGGG